MNQEEKSNAVHKYPGVAPNIADHDKVNKKAVKADVKNLNNNPRNNDLEMP